MIMLTTIFCRMTRHTNEGSRLFIKHICKILKYLDGLQVNFSVIVFSQHYFLNTCSMHVYSTTNNSKPTPRPELFTAAWSHNHMFTAMEASFFWGGAIEAKWVVCSGNSGLRTRQRFFYFYIFYFRFLQKYIFDLEIYRNIPRPPGSGVAGAFLSAGRI